MIDDIEYTPINEKDNTYRIGVAITTYDRPGIFSKSLDNWIKYSSDEIPIIIIDDGSTKDYKFSYDNSNIEYYKNNDNLGIPLSKNLCIEKLIDKGCTHLFLADDDIYPVCNEWWKPYIDSNINHLQYCFENWSTGNPVGDDKIVEITNNTEWHKHGRGVLLYFNKLVIDKVGGYDTIFNPQMGEHLELSERIFHAGLIPWPYIDVLNSDKLFYCIDEHKHENNLTTSKPSLDRRKIAALHDQIVMNRSDSWFKDYVEYKTNYKTLVLSELLTNTIDPQRGSKYNNDLSSLDSLVNSLPNNWDFKLINDVGLDNYNNVVNVPTTEESAYLRRFRLASDYIISHNEYDIIWLVDATDVVLLNKPTKLNDNTLYVGWENSTTNSKWMKSNFKDKIYDEITNNSYSLYNCGVIGGRRDIVIELLNVMNQILVSSNSVLEMGAFNLALYKYFKGRIVSGPQVTTLFKGNEINNSSWWKHK